MMESISFILKTFTSEEIFYSFIFVRFLLEYVAFTQIYINKNHLKHITTISSYQLILLSKLRAQPIHYLQYELKDAGEKLAESIIF